MLIETVLEFINKKVIALYMEQNKEEKVQVIFINKVLM